MKEKIEDLLKLYENDYGLDSFREDEDGNEFDCCEEIKQLFKDNNKECKISVDEMYESCGYDVDSFVIAWVDNNKVELYIDRFCRY